MVTLYDYLPSGNGYKARLAMSMLGQPFQLIEKDVLKGETRTPEFLALNPNGRIPVLQLPDGRALAESNAILFFLAGGTPLFPKDQYERGQVMQWLFFEQYSHEPNVAVARFWIHILGERRKRAAELEAKWRRGYRALDVMEGHLAGRDFFVSNTFTIADIGLYAYTHVADEGAFDLGRYPHIRAWLDRVADQPGHIPITQSTFD